MIDSAWRLGDVVDQGAGRASEPVVEVDAGGQGEQALEDSSAEVVQRAGAVAFEGEQVFGGPEDGLDALADGSDVGAVVGLVGAPRAHDGGAHDRDGGGELAARVAL